VLHKSGAVTRLRLHGPVEFDEKGIAHGKCHWCKSSIELPIQLAKDAEIERPEVFILNPQTSS
jgi:hypothetical protein